jgi:hypothetical protein
MGNHIGVKVRKEVCFLTNCPYGRLILSRFDKIKPTGVSYEKKCNFNFRTIGILTVTTVFAQTPKAKKILDKTVPADQSAIIFASKGTFIHRCDDTTFGIVTDVLAVNNLKGAGPNGFDEIGKPILQIPAGVHTITGNLSDRNENNYGKGRKVTHDFLPGHYYQMVIHMNLTEGDIAKELVKLSASAVLTGMEWCFLDITEEVKAKKKKSSYMEATKRGEIGVGQTIEKVPTITNPGAK